MVSKSEEYDEGVVPTKEPYQKRTSHGMILGENGEKMSKSRGNVVNPDDIVRDYGADTFAGPPQQGQVVFTHSVIAARGDSPVSVGMQAVTYRKRCLRTLPQENW